MATVASSWRPFVHCPGPPRRVVRTCAGPLPSARHPDCPGPAAVARTIVDLTHRGTLATLLPSGVPLATAATYTLDGTGQPILRLRRDAVHTINLQCNSAASLFVQPAAGSASTVGRLTLIGSVKPVQPALLMPAIESHARLASGAVGCDAPSPDDEYAVLEVAECYLVDHLAGGSAAEVVTGNDYGAAEPDCLRASAADLVTFMNDKRVDDLIMIAADQLGCAVEELEPPTLLWVDSQGFYLSATPPPQVNGAGGAATGPQTLRVCFPRTVQDDRGARSAFTMMAQAAWEKQRLYVPVILKRILSS